MAGLRSITDFRSKLVGGGARPNLFQVELPGFPAAIKDKWGDTLQKDFKFMCKAAALPASNVAAIEVPFRGKTLKVAGDRTFDTWTITVINDESFDLRKAFEDWMKYINNHTDAEGPSNPGEYQENAFVYQLKRDYASADVNNAELQDSDAIIYTLFGIFPTNVSQIDLSYDSTDTIEEFTVEFQVQYWERGKFDDR
jgi:hypothetical protein